MFAKKLISIMEDQGLCQKDLHNLTGIPTPSISGYVGGHSVPSIHRIEAIAKALNVQSSDLMDESKPAQRELVLKKVTISEAAHRLGKSLDFVRASLEQGTAPFGFAAKIGDTWSYHISPSKFDGYLRQEGAIK